VHEIDYSSDGGILEYHVRFSCTPDIIAADLQVPAPKILAKQGLQGGTKEQDDFLLGRSLTLS
jgi:hypothetical protein